MKYNVPVSGKNVSLNATENEDGSLQVTQEDWKAFDDKVRQILAPNSMSMTEFLNAIITNEED